MKIAIVGGGAAGLAAAWLLDPQHEVVLFEKQDRLGGHADTVDVRLDSATYQLDTGFEFFSAGMFPVFTRLLDLLQVPLVKYPISATIYNNGSGRATVLPPSRGGKPLWSQLKPDKLFDLLQFALVLRSARRLMASRDTSITIGDFVEKLPLSAGFKGGFLYPLLLAGWCVEPEDHRSFMAYDVLRYTYMHRTSSLKHFTMLDIHGGVRTYVQALAGSLRNTSVFLGTEIAQVRPGEQGCRLASARGDCWEADAVVLATNANQAASVLSGGAPDASRSHAASLLRRIEYFETRIAIHGDARLMPANPADWSVVNTRIHGPYSSNTIWKPWRVDGRPIFKSWVTYDEELPTPCYSLAAYWHPKVNAAYFETQKALQQHQGQGHLWYAGMYTHDVDCHESAVVSAVKVVRSLAPDSPRLKQLEV